MKETLKAYIDLTRLHFGFAWPLLICSGLLLAFTNYGGFSTWLTVKVALIGFFGFDGGMILNDYVDRDLDKLEVESDLTTYWRPFNTRPLITGDILPKNAFTLFLLFVGGSFLLILTLPYPNFLYILSIMAYGYAMEYFYQVKKRSQTYPIAQL
ncbi:MAG: prenyltransferase, partial [Candidatus Korarchaeota archaeon]|nr:prenyltransferase [Candidatus Korarchaeota archaeon]NIU82802.1 prenyltransferase [Candidatus Thorarchaeota archaeon]NIW13295.1 prenyltransferase [Candidatus Thorarchaeota archaeon]NIW52151.1 prenyltransferase [Candidatus Korarchaeota archaeon]